MTPTPLCIIQFQPLGKRISIPQGTSILDAARQAGIDLNSACGGEGNCGQCRVVPLEGETNPLTADEEFLLDDRDLVEGYRLACCTKILSDFKVHLPKETLVSGQRLQVESSLRSLTPDPSIRAFDVELPPPDLHDARSDLTRLLDALEAQPSFSAKGASLSVIKSISPALRQNKWHAAVFADEQEIVAVRPAGQRPLGLAVDLGTTKVAAHLIELETGETVASGGAPNPQISYGEDVITRLNYAIRNPDGDILLASKVRQTINELLGELLQQTRGEREQVAEACIVGNTAMTHLLLQYPVRQLSHSPFVAAASDALDVPASQLDLQMAPGAKVHIPASIGGFVGADHVAMVLACDLDETDKVTLGVDIGTNTEISLRVPGASHLTAVSCASGPAFEGAHIRDGMRAASGAIEKVRITTSGPELTTIDDEPAVGLCGSGILDSVAELYRNGYLNSHGRFDRQREAVRRIENGAEYVLVPAGRSGSGRDIVITQGDVNEIQLAKGAIYAGLKILLETTGTQPEAVQEVIIAGAFGSFLNIENAIRIGLFPHFPNAQYRQVGNAAAVGAKWILISRAARQRAMAIADNTNYLELTTYPKFSHQFALGMLFPDGSKAALPLPADEG